MPMRGEGVGLHRRADGVILTNAHVVDGAREVTVKLTDKREFAPRSSARTARATSRC